jgi:tellurite methyltransferase
MISWLKPGGLIIYEAYTTNQKQVKGHRDFEDSQYLKPQELLTLFPKMRVLKYEEPVHEKKFRASIILKKE